jgi:mRNA-degrading endonuclease RelE of RelBE toxin-antitoxin system
VVLIETRTFTRQILTLLSDEEYRQFQDWLVASPDLGKLIPGTSGLRKIRVAVKGKGKRGGGRVIYFWIVNQSRILLLFAYHKNEMEDLTSTQLAHLVAVVNEELDSETGFVQ